MALTPVSTLPADYYSMTSPECASMVDTGTGPNCRRPLFPGTAATKYGPRCQRPVLEDSDAWWEPGCQDMHP